MSRRSGVVGEVLGAGSISRSIMICGGAPGCDESDVEAAAQSGFGNTGRHCNSMLVYDGENSILDAGR